MLNCCPCLRVALPRSRDQHSRIVVDEAAKVNFNSAAPHMRVLKCDALFLKGAWSGHVAGSAPRAALPVGWQTYRDQLWRHPGGKLRYSLKGLDLCICHGDLLEHLQGAGAIVNSANKFLTGPSRPEYWMFSSYAGTSVEEAIHRRAGPELLQACKQLPDRGGEGIRCPVGKARPTPGTSSLLPDGFIIHAVAPGWHAFETSSGQLTSAWQCSLDLAVELDVGTVVMPALGCGTNRAPLEDAAACALAGIQEWSSQSDSRSLELRLVLHTQEAWTAWTTVAFNTLRK